MDTFDLVGQLQIVLDRLASGLLNMGPRLVTAVFLMLLGIAVAYVLRFITRRLVSSLDRLIPSRLLRASLRTVAIGDSASRMLGTVVYWFVILIFLAAASETVGLPLMTAWLSGAARYLPSVLSALVIVFAGVVAGVFLRDVSSSTLAGAGLPNSAALARVLQTVTVLVSVMIAVDQLGVDTALLTALMVTVLGVALLGGALAFGLGARTEVSNILASHYLQKSYRIGNRVRIGDLTGEIIRITNTSVVLESEEGRVAVPAKLFSETASTLTMEG